MHQDASGCPDPGVYVVEQDRSQGSFGSRKRWVAPALVAGLVTMSQRIDLEQMHMTGQMATAALPLALFLQSAKKSVVDFWSSVTHTLGHVADCSGLSSVVGVTHGT